MPEFQLQPGEQLIRESEVLWMKAKLLAKSGRLILTNRRLVFDQAPTHVHTQGLLGYFVGVLIRHLFPSLQGGVLFDIPVIAIVYVGKETFGLNTMLSIIYSGSEKVRFGVGKSYEEWETALSLSRSPMKLAA